MRVVPLHTSIDIEKALPPDRLALLRAVADVAAARRMALYIVGGLVRDLLLGLPGLDFDLVVDGDAISLAHALADKYGGRVTAHTRFGTAKWFLRDSRFGNREPSSTHPPQLPALDFISARSETYAHPGALPTVKSGSLADDLRRRDFTVNTLALRLDGKHFGELRDEMGGLNDLRDGLVRVLHPLSFIDDPTRMLRAVRFEQRFGFHIDTHTLQLMDKACPLLGRVSGARIHHELNLILAEENAADMMARLAELNLLKNIHPSLPWNEDLHRSLDIGLRAALPAEWRSIPDLRRVPRRQALGYLLWLFRLMASEIYTVVERLRLSATLHEALLSASDLWKDLPDITHLKPSQIVVRLDDVPLLVVYTLFLMAACEERMTLENYAVHWRHIRPKTTGRHLEARGLPPGPAYQSILRRLRAALLDGEVKTTQEEQALLNDLIRGAD